jgi:hypothetical protein
MVARQWQRRHSSLILSVSRCQPGPRWAITLGTALITAGAALLGSFIRGRQERALEHERGKRERRLRLYERGLEVGGGFSTIAHSAISGGTAAE